MKPIYFASCVLSVSAIATALGGSIHGLTTDNRLVAFDRANPSVLLNDVPITGLADGDSLLGIDFRPATRQLWGVSESRLYVINPNTGVATDMTAGTPFSVPGDAIGFDFNPAVDRIRLVGIDDQDLRLNPLTGGLAFTDGSLVYGDGSDMRATASAYKNNVAGTTTTTLYNLDAGPAGLNLTIQAPPNNGINTLVASVTGIAGDFNELNTGFDIVARSSFGYVSLNHERDSSVLYRLDLSSGAATSLGEIGSGLAIRDIAAAVPDSSPTVAAALFVGGLGWFAARRRSLAPAA